MSDVMIHDLAMVHPKAKLGKGVSVGPFCIIGEHAEIGDNTSFQSHVIVEGHTIIGPNNKFHPFCSIGATPQDLTYKGEPTKVIIGENNTFREYVSIHRGTTKENHLTQIGSDSLFMAYVHLGHDVVVGNHVILANTVNVAGHVHIEEKTIIGGGCFISQFVSIGKGCYIGGASAIDRDIPHFCTAYGNRVRLKGINIIGLRRSKYQRQEISDIIEFYRAMESSALSPRSFIDHEENLTEFKHNQTITEITEFIRKTEIGIAPFTR